MDSPRFQSLKAVRIATWVFPPLGLFLLWRSKQIKLRWKLLGTIFNVPFFAVLETVVIVLVLMRYTGLEVEWKGGFPPVLTWHKTHPNYQAVEKSRAAQASIPAPVLSSNAPAYWIGFRGPNRDGHYDEKPISTNWPAAGLRQLWKQPVGGGYASFAVAQGMAFTIEQRRDMEAVTAYDVQTGREIWNYSYPAHFDESMGGEGPRATPVWNDGKIYSLGALGDLACLDAATGKLIWKLNVATDNQADVLTWGFATSPLVVGDKLIVFAGGRGGKSVVAYDKMTGKPVWKVLNDSGAYDSPMLVDLAGKQQLILVTAERAIGLDVDKGELLWQTPWVVKINNRDIAQPVVIGTNRFFLSAGYGTGCEVVEVTPSGAGFIAAPVWRNTFLKNKFTSSVYWDGFIYGLDEDILVCLDAQTGERKWKDGRYGYGQVLLASGHLVVLGGDGVLALVKASPAQFEEVAKFQAIEGKTWNYPAIADGKIFVRNAVEMACFDLKNVPLQ